MMLTCSLLLSAAFAQDAFVEDQDTGGAWHTAFDADAPDLAPIVGGDQVNPGDWPEVALLVGNGGLCTATLIGPKVVLTADHCVDTGVAALMFDTTDYQRDQGLVIEASGIAEVIRYGRQGYDMALVLLEERAPVDPVPIALDCVLRDQLQDGERAWMVGFGATREDGGGFNSRLNEAGTIIVDRNCDSATIDGVITGCLPEPINPGGEVAGMNDDTHVCYGDSGGPLFLRGPGGPYVAGVASRLFLGSPGNLPCSSGSIWVRPDALIDTFEADIGRRVLRYPTCNEAPSLSVPGELISLEDQTIQTQEGLAVDIPMEVDDPDAEGELTWSIVREPANGRATVSPTGVVTYTPGEGFVGVDDFTVAATDAGIERWPRTGAPQTGEFDVVVTVLERGLCGCASASGPLASWLLLLPGLLWLRRRRA